MENTRQNYFMHKGKKVCSGSSIHYKGEHFDEEGTLSKYVSLYGTFLYIDGDLMYIQSFDNKVYYCKEYDEDHIIVHNRINDEKEDYFDYDDIKVYSGSKLYIHGEYFDKDGKRDYKGYWPCTFLYTKGDDAYINLDGEVYRCPHIQSKISRIAKLNDGISEKKIANPATEEDVRIAKYALIAAMGTTSIFKFNFLWWILELIVYLGYTNKKKYDE